LGVAHGMSVKFGLWMFYKLKKGRRISTLLAWFPSSYLQVFLKFPLL